MIRLKNKPVSKNELNKDEMFTTEILQHLHTIPELHTYLDNDENEDEEEIEVWSDDQKEDLKRILLDAPQASRYLKERLKSM